MKKFLRFPLYAAMAAMMTFNFSACSDDDEPDGGDTELSEKIKDIRLLQTSLPRIQ